MVRKTLLPLLLFFAIPAFAQTSIPISNPSFEAPVTFSGSDSLGSWAAGTVPSWTLSPSNAGGVFLPAASVFSPIPDGQQVVTVWMGGTVSQDTKVAAQPGTYNLSVSVGNRVLPSNFVTQSYTVSVMVGTTVLCSTNSPNASIPVGTWTKVSLPCTVASPAPPGNIVVSLGCSGNQCNFDNVSLTSPAPPPVSLITTKINTSLFWCTKCDNSAGDNVPMAGNLVISQNGTTSSWGIGADGSVSINLAINVATDPADFMFFLTDANGVAQQGTLEWKLSQAQIQSNAGFMLGTLGLPGLKFLKMIDPAGNPYPVFKGWTTP